MCLRLANHSQVKHALFHLLAPIMKSIPDMKLFGSLILPLSLIKS